MQPEELRALRKSAGMSQTEFAEALGMSQTFISQMERGVYPVEKRTGLAARWIAQEVIAGRWDI